MLPAGSRLRRRADFTSTLRRSRGVRAGGLLVVHVAVDTSVASPETSQPGAPADSPAPARVGFVVSRAVGPAVTRNRVRRRLRHIAAARMGDLPAGAAVVIRALPDSAAATFAQLDAALGRTFATSQRLPVPHR